MVNPPAQMCVVVPSRGRPQNIRRLQDAFNGTAHGVAVLWVCVDDDDPALPEYLALEGVEVEVGPRLRLGGTLNAVVPRLAKHYPVVGFMGDDHLPQTNNWAQILINEIDSQGDCGMVYGNDLIQGAALPTAIFMSSYIVKTLGYVVPRGSIHLFLDDYWLALGRRTEKIKYVPEVIIEHLHPLVGKTESDAGYVEVNAPEVWAHDEKIFLDYLANDMDEAVRLLNG